MTEQRDDREAFEAAYANHMTESLGIVGSPKAISGLREGDGYPPEYSYLSGCWNGWKLASAALSQPQSQAQGEAVAWQARTHPDSVWFDIPEWRVKKLKELGAEIRPLYAAPVAAQQSEPSAGAQPLPVELLAVAETVAKGGGFWAPCTGCYDTEDGRPTQRYEHSDVFGCELGNGCRECGGLGAVWDDTDYAAMAAAMEGKDAAAPAPSACPACSGKGTLPTGERAMPEAYCPACYGKGTKPSVSPAELTDEQIKAIGLEHGFMCIEGGRTFACALAFSEMRSAIRSLLASKPSETRDADEYEMRADGKRVHKGRWEDGFRSIVSIVRGPRGGFEIDEIVELVRGLALDAERYRLARRGQHWSVVDGIGNALRAEELDAAIDAALAAQRERGAA